MLKIQSRALQRLGLQPNFH